MTVWIALLRGVNVGGHNKLPMADFRAMLGDLGLASVATYIQSGTAVFSSDQPEAALIDMIGEGIESNFGFRPSIILRTLAQFQAALTGNPYTQADADPKTLHLFFLSEPMRDFDSLGLREFATNGEEFSLTDEVFYLYTPNGFGNSKTANKMDRFFKVRITGRNLRSCNKIAELAAAI